MRDHRGLLLVGAALVAILVTILAAKAFDWVPDRGTLIMRDIEALGDIRILGMTYSGDESDSGPQLAIRVRSGVSGEAATSLICTVIMPAVARGEPPKWFSFVVLDPSGGYLLGNSKTLCP